MIEKQHYEIFHALRTISYVTQGRNKTNSYDGYPADHLNPTISA